jgi:hypothetical protein
MTNTFFMKWLFALFFFVSLNNFGQPIKSGIYTFKYCDIEYNKCLSTCKVVIKGYVVTIYATKELAKQITGIKTGDILIKGLLTKDKKGKWVIKDKTIVTSPEEEIHYIDFLKKEFWRL